MKGRVAGFFIGLILGGLVTGGAHAWTACTNGGPAGNFTGCAIYGCWDVDCSLRSDITKELNHDVAGGGENYVIANPDTGAVSAIIYNYDTYSCPEGYEKQQISMKTVVNTSLPCCNRVSDYRGFENYMLSTCIKKQCAVGTYGDGITCTTCPSPGTSSSGSTKQDDCYVTGGSDVTGTFKYTSNCYYKN